MVKSGALATTSLVPGVTADAKWEAIHDGLSRFAGRALPVDTEVYRSASETNDRNRSIARLVRSYGGLCAEASEVTDLCTRQCCLSVTASLITVIGEARFIEGVETRQTSLDSARTELAELRSQSAIVNDLTDGNPLRAWPELSTLEKRTLLNGLLDEVVLTSAGGRKRWASPIAERAEIVLRGGSSLQ